MSCVKLTSVSSPLKFVVVWAESSMTRAAANDCSLFLSLLDACCQDVAVSMDVHAVGPPGLHAVLEGATSMNAVRIVCVNNATEKIALRSNHAALPLFMMIVRPLEMLKDGDVCCLAEDKWFLLRPPPPHQAADPTEPQGRRPAKDEGELAL